MKAPILQWTFWRHTSLQISNDKGFFPRQNHSKPPIIYQDPGSRIPPCDDIPMYVHELAYSLPTHPFPVLGAFMGGPQCRLSILRNGNGPCRYFRKFPINLKIVQCRLSILRNTNGPCHYFLNSPVDFK